MSGLGAPCAYCIICAKPDELHDVSQILKLRFPDEADNSRRDQPIYVVGRRKEAPPVTVLATCCEKMGHVYSASKTAQVLSLYSPTLVLFVGTAASLNPGTIRLGDVVVPQAAIYRMYDKIVEKGERAYDSGIAEFGDAEKFFGENLLLSALATQPLSQGAQQISAMYDGSTPLEDGVLEPAWAEKLDRMRKPKVERDIEILTCGMLVNSQTYKKFLRSMASRKAEVIDMESFGFFKAIDQLKNTEVGEGADGLMIRGISDYGGRKEGTESRSDNWKGIATRNAAAVACDIIRQHFDGWTRRAS